MGVRKNDRGRGALIMTMIGLGLIVGVMTAAASIARYPIVMESWSPYYQPVSAQVTDGTPIVWKNRTASHHTVTHDGCVDGGECLFDSRAVEPDGTFIISGLPPGRYSYHCRLHPIMRGELIVRPDSTNAAQTS